MLLLMSFFCILRFTHFACLLKDNVKEEKCTFVSYFLNLIFVSVCMPLRNDVNSNLSIYLQMTMIEMFIASVSTDAE